MCFHNQVLNLKPNLIENFLVTYLLKELEIKWVLQKPKQCHKIESQPCIHK